MITNYLLGKILLGKILRHLLPNQKNMYYLNVIRLGRLSHSDLYVISIPHEFPFGKVKVIYTYLIGNNRLGMNLPKHDILTKWVNILYPTEKYVLT